MGGARAADPRAHVWQGGDAKDALLGRVFAYAAVARSGRLGGRGAGAADAARVASALVDAMRRKSFLREVTQGFVQGFWGGACAVGGPRLVHVWMQSCRSVSKHATRGAF